MTQDHIGAMPPGRVADLLEASSALIEAEMKALGPDAAWHPAPGEWCAHEVVGHLIEADKRGFAGRIRLFLERDHPRTEAWDQVETARARADCARGTEGLLAEFAAVRRQSVALVRSLRPEDLGRSGEHSKVGDLFVRDLLQEWVHHDRNHTRQLLAIAQERAWPHMGNSQKFQGE